MPDTIPKAQGQRLAGRVAIVTGGSSGIGRATCLAMAREGASIVAVGRNRNRLDELVARIDELDADGGPALALALDVRSEPDMERMATETLGRFGKIDILVASAGILRPPATTLTTVARTPIEVWDEVIATNVRGTFLSNRAVLPHMLDRKSGEIVNLSSKAGLRGVALDAPYCASKFAVIGLTESLAEETRGLGVRVQLVAPGNFDTPVWSQNGPLVQPADLPPPGRVADLIVAMVTLPADTRVHSPIIEATTVPTRPAWLGRSDAVPSANQ